MACPYSSLLRLEYERTRVTCLLCFVNKHSPRDWTETSVFFNIIKSCPATMLVESFPLKRTGLNLSITRTPYVFFMSFSVVPSSLEKQAA